MQIKRLLGFVSLFLAVFFFIGSASITGAAIGLSGTSAFYSYTGLGLLILSLVLFMAGEESELEKQVKSKKLFQKNPKTGKMIVRDYAHVFGRELHFNPNTDSAKDLLESLKTYLSDPDIRDTFREDMQKVGYITNAESQRAGATELKIGSEEWYADKFLTLCSNRYARWKKPLHPLLRIPKLKELKEERLPAGRNYNANDVVTVMKANIPNLEFVGKRGHEFIVKYRNVPIQLCAGTYATDETDTGAIDKVIKRIAEEDLKSGLPVQDLDRRKRVLKYSIYRDAPKPPES